MMDSVRGEIQKRTGLDAATIDTVLNALGQVVSERYPQFAGLLGPALGINTGGAGTGSAGSTGGAGQGMPDLGQLGKIFGGGGGASGGTSGTGGTGSPQGEKKS